jgi:hypothetical protein
MAVRGNTYIPNTFGHVLTTIFPGTTRKPNCQSATSNSTCQLYSKRQLTFARGPDLVCISGVDTGQGHFLSSGTGTKIVKVPEGLHNKAFILTMDNGMEVVAKLPNPNAGPARYTTASEVATRKMVCMWPSLRVRVD